MVSWLFVGSKIFAFETEEEFLDFRSVGSGRICSFVMLECDKLMQLLGSDIRQNTDPVLFHNATVPPGFRILAADTQNPAMSNQCAYTKSILDLTYLTVLGTYSCSGSQEINLAF